MQGFVPVLLTENHNMKAYWGGVEV